MLACDFINLENGGFVICDGIFIPDVYHIIIRYDYPEVELKNKNDESIGFIGDIKSRKECKFIEKIDKDKVSSNNYMEKCLVKNGQFVKGW